MTYIVDDNGQQRFLGNNPAPLRMNWEVFGETDTTKLIPESQWKDIVDAMPGGAGPDWPYLPPVHDQNGVGQCNADATTGAMESQRLKQGLFYVALSSGDLYDRINGGRDNGSLLEDGLQEAFNGIATVEDCGGNIWRKGNWRKGTPDQRKKYRLIEAFICPTFAHCFSAVCQGFDLISGVMWKNNFNPDSQGWLPESGTGGGGHAVHGFKPTYRDNKWGIWHQNSWSQWGLSANGTSGLCVFPERIYSGPVGGWWAVRVVTYDDTGEIPIPKL